ncbi:Fe-S protein assembly co-chaperone HscB [Roseateles cellulosilyticus]|uniref:Co-chaperone protein HscB homolog n=1 Tax=Pelomonas cellulosilytica TaxID=2906762 RepID=A0ABS8XXJ4_9BURK|nr:Fe-S protein assembly co-chaperone HscB [Pelomonas sp. P8]MCE4555993.1 Fe-S protein assembly co-chaperone HscB [Pelomonas sp. P8]
MRLTDNDFQLFGLPERQVQDRAAIDARWKALQAEVHPDRFAADGAAAQRVAMQWAMRVNEAYQRLRDPLARAAYLCELRGAPVQAENNTQMPPAFLMQQMTWREALDDAADEASLQALDDEAARAETAALERARTLLDEAGDAPAAASQVRALMFIQRFRADIDKRLAALDA